MSLSEVRGCMYIFGDSTVRLYLSHKSQKLLSVLYNENSFYYSKKIGIAGGRRFDSRRAQKKNLSATVYSTVPLHFIFSAQLICKDYVHSLLNGLSVQQF